MSELKGSMTASLIASLEGSSSRTVPSQPRSRGPKGRPEFRDQEEAVIGISKSTSVEAPSTAVQLPSEFERSQLSVYMFEEPTRSSRPPPPRPSAADPPPPGDRLSTRTTVDSQASSGLFARTHLLSDGRGEVDETVRDSRSSPRRREEVDQPGGHVGPSEPHSVAVENENEVVPWAFGNGSEGRRAVEHFENNDLVTSDMTELKLGGERREFAPEIASYEDDEKNSPFSRDIRYVADVEYNEPWKGQHLRTEGGFESKPNDVDDMTPSHPYPTVQGLEDWNSSRHENMNEIFPMQDECDRRGPRQETVMLSNNTGDPSVGAEDVHYPSLANTWTFGGGEGIQTEEELQESFGSSRYVPDHETISTRSGADRPYILQFEEDEGELDQVSGTESRKSANPGSDHILQLPTGEASVLLASPSSMLPSRSQEGFTPWHSDSAGDVHLDSNPFSLTQSGSGSYPTREFQSGRVAVGQERTFDEIKPLYQTASGDIDCTPDGRANTPHMPGEMYTSSPDIVEDNAAHPDGGEVAQGRYWTTGIPISDTNLAMDEVCSFVFCITFDTRR